MAKINNELVSIIILTFNSEKFISRCLKAISRQTYKNLEVVLVDAGSKDQTLNIVKKFKKKINVKILSAPGSNMGEARNLGLDHAGGDYITFCDSDDYYLRNKIQKQVCFLQKNSFIDCCFSDAFHFYTDSSKKKFLNQKNTCCHGKILEKILKRQFINLNTLALRAKKKNIPRFPIGIRGKFGEDWKFIIDLAKNNYQFHWIPGNDVVVEIRKDSHTSWDRQWLMKLVALDHFKKDRLEFHKMGVRKVSLQKTYWSRCVKFYLSCLICNSKAIKKIKKLFSTFPLCKRELALALFCKKMSILNNEKLIHFIIIAWTWWRKQRLPKKQL